MRRFLGAVLMGLVALACGDDLEPGQVSSAPPDSGSSDAALDARALDSGAPDGECPMWRHDEDGDGYGAGRPFASCPELGPGFVRAGGPEDCAPNEPRAHPGQTEYFTTAIVGAHVGFGDFDFDCSGKVEPQPNATTCEDAPCGGFWSDGACGENRWVLECHRGTNSCFVDKSESRPRGCR